MSVRDLKWQIHDERRARPRTTVDADGATELFNDAANDEQSQTESVGLAVRGDALERLEDASVQLGSDTDAAVDHLEASAARPVGAGADQHRPSLAVLD